MTSIHNSIICNPFTLTVLIFASTLTISSLLIPAQQLAPLDKVVALLESIAMFYIAYPAAVTTGKVLLQTAPPGIETLDGDMGRLKRVIEEVRSDFRSMIVSLRLTDVSILTKDREPRIRAIPAYASHLATQSSSTSSTYLAYQTILLWTQILFATFSNKQRSYGDCYHTECPSETRMHR